MSRQTNIIGIHKLTQCQQRLLKTLLPDYKTGQSSCFSDTLPPEECFSCSQILIELSGIIGINLRGFYFRVKTLMFSRVEPATITRGEVSEQSAAEIIQ